MERGKAERENAERQKYGREPTQQLLGQGLIEGGRFHKGVGIFFIAVEQYHTMDRIIHMYVIYIAPWL